MIRQTSYSVKTLCVCVCVCVWAVVSQYACECVFYAEATEFVCIHNNLLWFGYCVFIVL